MRNGLYENLYIKQLNVQTALSDANYPTSTSYIDVSQFRRFAFLVSLGSLDSAVVFQVKQDTSATETAIKNVTGATFTAATSGVGGDNYDYLIECETSALDENNSFRYVTLNVASTGGGNDYAAITFIGYDAREVPVTQPSTLPAADHILVTN